MEIYLVGGAIRNQLLGLPVKEKDWVVVGSSPEEMLERQYKPVGKDFPVFLHPTTHEEYALARTERKTGKGYKGFEFYAAPDVTLIDDLKRRDLTINAIAQNEAGELIDPYHGQEDIKSRTFRHVSPAFAEDPVRILRTARFAAQLPEFTVSPDTLTLMRKMVKDGEVDALIAERVWKECEKALLAEQPHRFFDVLTQCQAAERLWPTWTLDDTNTRHFQQLCQQTTDGPIRFAILTRHLPINDLNTLLQRYRVPKDYKDLALLTHQAIRELDTLDTTSATAIFSLLKNLDALRRPERFKKILTTCQYCMTVPLNECLRSLPALLNAIDTRSLQEQGLSGRDLGCELDKQRLALIQQQLRS